MVSGYPWGLDHLVGESSGGHEWRTFLVPRPLDTCHMVKAVGDQPIGLAIYTLFTLTIKDAVFQVDQCVMGKDRHHLLQQGTEKVAKQPAHNR